MSNYKSLLEMNSTKPQNVAAPSLPGSVVDIRLIPEFGSCGYSVLQHGGSGSNTGYFSLCSAYPNCGNSCTKYVTPACPGQRMQNLGS